MYKEYLQSIFSAALLKIGVEYTGILQFEYPKNPEHGDLSTNIAMQLARQLKNAPVKIAQDIIDKLSYDSKKVSSVSIAGAGFINIKFTPAFFTSFLFEISNAGKEYGKNNTGHDKKANIEYVSVNPTGLLHLGHGRNACIGDTIANLYEWNGWDVTREYYFNNAGNQMNNLAKSIYARYMQQKFDEAYPFPEDGYHGDYIREIAQELYEKNKDEFAEGKPEDLASIKKFGEEWCFYKIKQTLKRMNIRQDVYFNEDSLYKDKKINDLLDELDAKGLTYHKDGAIWFSLSKIGLEDDRVIVKSTGEPTYRLPDIAYHKEKFLREYDLIVDVFGSDHIATVPDVLAGIKALDFDTEKVKVVIHQFVTLTEEGHQVKMSKRTGKSYTLDDLLDEVGPDVVRFFLIMRGVSTHLEFDLSLAREQSEKNPVFYLQYAHARISSVFENAKEKGIIPEDEVNYGLLVHDKEINLIKILLDFPVTVEVAAIRFEPHILSDYLREVASNFHAFYHDCRIIGAESKELMHARFKLAEMVKTVLKNGLDILGISAPERM